MAAWARCGLLLRCVVVGLCYAAAYRAGFEFAVAGPDVVTALWLPNGFVVVLMAFDESARLALIAAPFWAAALIGGYVISRRFNPRHAEYVELSSRPVVADRDEDETARA